MSFGTVILPPDGDADTISLGRYFEVFCAQNKISVPNAPAEQEQVYPTHMQWVDATNSHIELTKDNASPAYSVALDVTFNVDAAYNIKTGDDSFVLESPYPHLPDVYPVNSIPLNKFTIRYYFTDQNLANAPVNPYSSYGNYAPSWRDTEVRAHNYVTGNLLRFTSETPLKRILNADVFVPTNHPRYRNTNAYTNLPPSVPIMNPPSRRPPAAQRGLNPGYLAGPPTLEPQISFDNVAPNIFSDELGGDISNGVLPALLLSVARQFQKFNGGTFTKVKGDYQSEDIPINKDLAFTPDMPGYDTRLESDAVLHVESTLNFPSRGDSEFVVRGNKFKSTMGGSGPYYLSSPRGYLWREATSYLYNAETGIYKVTPTIEPEAYFYIWIDDGQWTNNLIHNSLFVDQNTGTSPHYRDAGNTPDRFYRIPPTFASWDGGAFTIQPRRDSTSRFDQQNLYRAGVYSGVDKNASFVQGSILLNYTRENGFQHACYGIQYRSFGPMDFERLYLNETHGAPNVRGTPLWLSRWTDCPHIEEHIDVDPIIGYKRVLLRNYKDNSNPTVYRFVGNKGTFTRQGQPLFNTSPMVQSLRKLEEIHEDNPYTETQLTNRRNVHQFPGNESDGMYLNIGVTGLHDIEFTIEPVSIGSTNIPLTAGQYGEYVGAADGGGLNSVPNKDFWSPNTMQTWLKQYETNIRAVRDNRKALMTRIHNNEDRIRSWDNIYNSAFNSNVGKRTVLLYGTNDSNYYKGISQIDDVTRLFSHGDLRLNDHNLLGLNYSKLIPEDPNPHGPWCLEP